MANTSEDDRFYRQIEKRRKFSIPDDYRKLRARNYMTLVKPFDPAMFLKPGNHYLHVYDIEWNSPEKIAGFESSNFMVEPISPHFVPFAESGAGDYWCWQTDHAVEKWGARVLLCNHDDGKARVFAANLTHTLFRQILQDACSNNYVRWQGTPNAAEDKKRIKQTRASLERYATDLAIIFPANWCAILTDISARKPSVWEGIEYRGNKREYYSLLSDEERKKIEVEQLSFPGMDGEFTWCK